MITTHRRLDPLENWIKYMTNPRKSSNAHKKDQRDQNDEGEGDREREGSMRSFQNYQNRLRKWIEIEHYGAAQM